MYQSRDGASVYDISLDAGETPQRDGGADSSLVFPDKELLFSADFRRSGSDLILIGEHRTAIIVDYFEKGRRPGLVTPDGAGLSGEVVEALAGAPNPGAFAQATPAAATQKAIGRVEKVSGSATVLRNGVPVELHLGDFVIKGDVVQTGSDSSVTIRFNDGTVFGLSSNARIVLNEMIYSADSQENSALFTLVQGVIGFVAGKVAKTGDMQVATPVATMAIRGTAVQTEVSASNGTTKFSLLTEPDGRVGSFVLLDRLNPTRELARITDPSVATVIAPLGSSDVRITQVSKTSNDIRIESDFVRGLFQSTSNQQRRGSSDPEGIPIVPAGLDPSFDRIKPADFTVDPFVSKLALLERSALAVPEVRDTIRIRGSATEDGPTVGLESPDQASLVRPKGDTLELRLPATLPLGVRYVARTESFTLDPSHPAYQHLGVGESETVTVTYSYVSSDLVFPVSTSWVVKGRNDVPVARNDRVLEAAEGRSTILSLAGNDSDIDGDKLKIVDWTQPLEGSVYRNASGELVFNPGRDFRALSEGQTATVSFTYTVSDGQGGTDTARATVQVVGAGTFTSRDIVVTDTGVLAFNNQPVSLTMDAPARTTTTKAELDLLIRFGAVVQPQMNILYVVDVSGSTGNAFAGAPVGDLNQDGKADTILDAQIAGLINLTERIRGLGFSPVDVSVTLIPFNDKADPAEETTAEQNAGNTAAITFSLGAAGDQTIANFLKSLDAGGGTNFEDALRASINRLEQLDQGDERNVIYFLSDGNGGGSIGNELAILNDDYGAEITAVGIGQDADLSILNLIDNTGGAERVTSTDQLDASLVGVPLPSGSVADLDVFVNGRELTSIGPEDLIATSRGWALDASISGLLRRVGATNTVSAVVTFASGEVLTTNMTIAGALPLSADLML